MDQINTTDINDISISYVHEKQNQLNFSVSCTYKMYLFIYLFIYKIFVIYAGSVSVTF